MYNIKFWMVIRSEGTGSNQTSMRHYTLVAAQQEAERLCRQEHADFIILESKLCCSLPQVPVSVSPIW